MICEAQRQSCGAQDGRGVDAPSTARHKRANSVTQHDIKLELDVRSQGMIERALRAAFPQVALLGEEGIAGRADARIALGGGPD